MNVWVIGDIHGCVLTLQALIEKLIMPSPGDTICFVGDYIDRGPSSKQVIDYIHQLSSQGYAIRALQGNHEEMLVNAYNWEKNHPKRWFRKGNPSLDLWLDNGGKDTLRSFNVERIVDIPINYISWMEHLPLYHSLSNYLIVHAGFNFNRPSIFEDTNAMKWIRYFDVDLRKTDGKRVVHGHVPVPLEVIHECISSDRHAFLAIDNGCVYKGRNGMGGLAAVELKQMKLLIQPNID